MKVKMLKTMRGCEESAPNKVNLYKQDETYEISSRLGGVFVREGWAKETKSKKEKKDAGAAPENK